MRYLAVAIPKGGDNFRGHEGAAFPGEQRGPVVDSWEKNEGKDEEDNAGDDFQADVGVGGAD